MQIDTEDVWQYILMILVLVLAGTGIFALAATKRVDGYYLSTAGNRQGGQATCVYAHWTWHSDELSFCTNNYQEALDFVAKANASIR